MEQPNDLAQEASSAASDPLEVKTLIPFDVVPLAIYVIRGWVWILLVGLVGGSVAFAAGFYSFSPKFTVQVQLVRREAQNSLQATEMGESFQPGEFNAATISAMMRSGDLLEKVGESLEPPLSIAKMQQALVIRPEKNTDLISVAFTSGVSASYVTTALNSYAGQVVELTRQLQAQEASELHVFISLQVQRIEEEIEAAQRKLVVFSRESGLYHAEKEIESLLGQISELDLKIEMARIERGTIDYRLSQSEAELGKQDPTLQRLALAQEKLADLGTQFTSQHPAVVEQEARVVVLEEAVATPEGDATASFRSTGNTVANNLYLELISLRGKRRSLDLQLEKLGEFRDERERVLKAIPDKSLEYIRLKGKVDALEEARALLRGRQREAGLFAEEALGYYRLFSPATMETVETSEPMKKQVIVGILGMVLGFGAVVFWRGVRAASSDGILSPGDLRRVSGRAVIAILPLEETMSEQALVRWRFSTWRVLTRSLPEHSGKGVVVGFISAFAGEGKTTWQRHLAQAALERGLRVIVVSQSAEGEASEGNIGIEEALDHPEGMLVDLSHENPAVFELSVGAGWNWAPSQLERWKRALETWRSEEGVVVLVELPPASRLQSLLLAETLPATIWLSGTAQKGRRESHEFASVLHDSGATLVGAVLNRVAPIYCKLPDLARFGLCLVAGLLLPHSLGAEEALIDSVDRAGGVETAERVPGGGPELEAWQERLTLGAGDVLNLQVYGHQQYSRSNVPIGPDGRLSYLQVHDFVAAGLTIDELREGLTRSLQEYMPNSQVIVTPQEYRSKKYFLLGTVLDRGAYTLDRPMTLVEAVARARGISTGLLSQNTVEIADMRRAFVVRNGKKLDVDFTKLFYGGDVSQNVQLNPGDYIHIPSNVVNEVYVLGAVESPGQSGVTDRLSALGAITVRGGFAAGAWKKKVLVVRNSLSEERQVFTVDAAAVLAGKARDIVLEPRDIVYVSTKPWKQVEEIVDIVIRSFLQSATPTWVGLNVKPFINE